MIEIRQATSADVDGIIRVCTEANWATYRPQGLLTDEQITASIAEYYTPERVGREVENISDAQSGYFVAVDTTTGEIVGAGCGGLWEPDVACLYCLYLDPNRKREGIGTKLLAAITNDAAVRGAKEQVVHAAKGNQMAIPFYEAQGFEFVREEPNHLNGSPEWVAKRHIGTASGKSQITYATDSVVTDSDLRVLYGSVGWSIYLDRYSDLTVLLPGCHLVMTAWDGNKLVGLIRTVGDGISIEYIQDILVNPDYQGRGIGAHLLDWVLEQSKDSYQVILTTDAGETGITARKLYEKHGLKQFANANGYTGFYRPQVTN